LYAGAVLIKTYKGRDLKTVTVYRVEHKEKGHGPYLDRNGIFRGVSGLHTAHERSPQHPGPRQDGLGWDVYGKSFAFPDRERMDWWFKDFKHKLNREGFVVNIYEVGEEHTTVSESGKQVIFEKDQAKLVDTQSVIGYSKYYQTN